MSHHFPSTPLDGHDDATPARTPGQDVDSIYGNATPVAHPWAGLVLEHA